MDEQWDAFVPKLESGNSGRVNDVIDEIEGMDLDERLELFDTCFEELTAIYAESDDGYVRQSTVRVAERLVPGLPVVVAIDNEERSLCIDRETVRGRTDAICGFLLEAITDDDGRVRQSAERGLRDVFRTYDALDDDGTIEALASELEAMASEHSGRRREQLLEVKSDAEFSMQSGLAGILKEFNEEFDDSV